MLTSIIPVNTANRRPLLRIVYTHPIAVEFMLGTSLFGLSLVLVSCSPATHADDAKTKEPAAADHSKADAEVERRSASTDALNPRYVCEAPDHDFGVVWVGVGPLTHEFTIRNDGQDELKILKVKTGCGCTQTGEFNRNLAPGEVAAIPISLDASRLRTKFFKKITLTLNDPERPTAELSLTGTPRRYIELDPPTLTFGQSKIDARLTKRMKIINQTDDRMELELIEDMEAWGNFAPKLIEKEPGKVFELVVEGVPPYDWNVNRGSFRIRTNIPQQPELTPYATVDVPPRLRVTPSTVEFRRKSSDPLTRRVMFANNGDTDVDVLSATVDDSDIICNLQKRTDGKEYQINLTFPAGYFPPSDGRTLTIRTDDVEFPVIEVPITHWVKPKGESATVKKSPAERPQELL